MGRLQHDSPPLQHKLTVNGFASSLNSHQPTCMFIVVSFLTGMARLMVGGGNDQRWDENSAIARAEFAAYGFRDAIPAAAA